MVSNKGIRVKFHCVWTWKLHRKLVHTAHMQQQLRYNAAQILCLVAISQLLTFILTCLGTNIKLCYFCELTSSFTRGRTKW